MLPAKMDTRAARVQLHATGFQESRFAVRRQYGPGPAVGFWQFEEGGGIKGVLTHPSTRDLARKACQSMGVEPTTRAVWIALQSQANDLLAVVFARLLYWADSRPIPPPDVAQAGAGWICYVRNWRPGHPHRDTWDDFWRAACAAYALGDR